MRDHTCWSLLMALLLLVSMSTVGLENVLARNRQTNWADVRRSFVGEYEMLRATYPTTDSVRKFFHTVLRHARIETMPTYFQRFMTPAIQFNWQRLVDRLRALPTGSAGESLSEVQLTEVVDEIVNRTEEDLTVRHGIKYIEPIIPNAAVLPNVVVPERDEVFEVLNPDDDEIIRVAPPEPQDDDNGGDLMLNGGDLTAGDHTEDGNIDEGEQDNKEWKEEIGIRRSNFQTNKAISKK